MAVTVYSQSSIPNDSDIGSGYVIGENVNSTSSVFYDLYVTDAQFWLSNPSSNSGTLTCGVYNGTTLKHTFWTKSMTTVGTSMALTSETSTPYESKLAVGDYVACTSTNWMKMGINLSDVFDGSNSCWTQNGTANTGRDAGFQITVDTSAPTPGPSGSDVFIPPPPAQVRL